VKLSVILKKIVAESMIERYMFTYMTPNLTVKEGQILPNLLWATRLSFCPPEPLAEKVTSFTLLQYK